MYGSFTSLIKIIPKYSTLLLFKKQFFFISISESLLLVCRNSLSQVRQIQVPLVTLQKARTPDACSTSLPSSCIPFLVCAKPSWIQTNVTLSSFVLSGQRLSVHQGRKEKPVPLQPTG